VLRSYPCCSKESTGEDHDLPDDLCTLDCTESNANYEADLKISIACALFINNTDVHLTCKRYTQCMHNPLHLPNNVDELKALLLAQMASIQALQTTCDTFRQERDTLRRERDLIQQSTDSRDAEIIRLKLMIEKLQRMLFGRKSEKLAHQIDQLELELEELYIARGQVDALLPTATSAPAPQIPAKAPVLKRAWPDTLPREIQLHVPEAACCPDCGGAWQTLGEDVSEVLEHVPATIKVIRHVRPRLACTQCDTMAQAAAPSRPIAKGAAGPGLLAHIMVSKYLDHQPIYRQCRIHARQGLELPESTVGDWVGEVHTLLRPLTAALQRYVLSAEKLHADDTPIAVLAPGTGKTKQARLWTYVRDDRPAGVDQAPAFIRRHICKASPASCKPMRMLGMTQSTPPVGLLKRLAGRMRGASFTTFM
jgi:transposase